MHVRVYATLRDLLGTKSVTVETDGETTVRQVLRRLVAEYPSLADKLWDEEENPTGYVTMLLNGRSLEYLDGLDTLVGESDSLNLFPPVGGG